MSDDSFMPVVPLRTQTVRKERQSKHLSSIKKSSKKPKTDPDLEKILSDEIGAVQPQKTKEELAVTKTESPYSWFIIVFALIIVILVVAIAYIVLKKNKTVDELDNVLDPNFEYKGGYIQNDPKYNIQPPQPHQQSQLQQQHQQQRKQHQRKQQQRQQQQRQQQQQRRQKHIREKRQNDVKPTLADVDSVINAQKLKPVIEVIEDNQEECDDEESQQIDNKVPQQAKAEEYVATAPEVEEFPSGQLNDHMEMPINNENAGDEIDLTNDLLESIDAEFVDK
jgi:hypothetical protein